MPRAEVTWNGVAKSYRVGTEVFQQNRSRTEDWPEEMVKYLESTKGFSVVRKGDAPAPKKVAAKTEAAPAEEEPAATEEPKDDDEEEVTTSAKPSSTRRSSRRSRSSD